jgi:hypothetical protein
MAKRENTPRSDGQVREQDREQGNGEGSRKGAGKRKQVFVLFFTSTASKLSTNAGAEGAEVMVRKRMVRTWTSVQVSRRGWGHCSWRYFQFTQFICFTGTKVQILTVRWLQDKWALLSILLRGGWDAPLGKGDLRRRSKASATLSLSLSVCVFLYVCRSVCMSVYFYILYLPYIYIYIYMYIYIWKTRGTG